MTFSRSTSVTVVLLSSASAVWRYWLMACAVEPISDLLAVKLSASVPSTAAAINAIAPKPPYLAIAARLLGRPVVGDPAGLGENDAGQQVMQKEAFAGAGKMRL